MGRQNSRLRPKMPVNLTQQRLLASKIMKVGKNKVWLDPLSSVVISAANSNSSIRKLIKEGTIVKVPMTVRSRFRANQKIAERKKGRHIGTGSRKGTSNARLSTKTIYRQKLIALRKTVKNYHERKKITSSEKRVLFLKIKGNCLKNRNAGKEAKIAMAQKLKLPQKSTERRARKEDTKNSKIQDKISNYISK